VVLEVRDRAVGTTELLIQPNCPMIELLNQPNCPLLNQLLYD
jgi:hypothetical protein